MAKIKYDCLKCVGYCCAIYERVQVSDDDLIRLGNYFGISPESAKRRYTKKHASGERVLRRTADPIFGQSCIFQDPVKRLCSIYEGRPEVCREWPTHGGGRCVYYDMLQFERRQQENPDVVPLIQITFLEGTQGR
ncbi:MAG: YkgJ family cysteine cluster protein [Bacteroidota bacterium]